jgi:molybdopterin molybdotransferase
LLDGQAIRIFTGGKIPEGTTHVARQEIVKVESETIRLIEQLKPQADIRFTGEEVKQGQQLADVGQNINIGALAALSMAGVQTVEVFQQPKVAVVITGDEVAEHPEDLHVGKVFDANGPLLKAWFKAYGIDVEILHIADAAEQVTACFERLKSLYDVIITTGGVSVGIMTSFVHVLLRLDLNRSFGKLNKNRVSHYFLQNMKILTIIAIY